MKKGIIKETWEERCIRERTVLMIGQGVDGSKYRIDRNGRVVRLVQVTAQKEGVYEGK